MSLLATGKRCGSSPQAWGTLIDKANQEDFILLDLSPDLDFDLYAAMPMDDPFMCEEVLLL